MTFEAGSTNGCDDDDDDEAPSSLDEPRCCKGVCGGSDGDTTDIQNHVDGRGVLRVTDVVVTTAVQRMVPATSHDDQR